MAEETQTTDERRKTESRLIDLSSVKPEIRTFLHKMDEVTNYGRKDGVLNMSQREFEGVFPGDIDLFKAVVGRFGEHFQALYSLTSNQYDLNVQFGGHYAVEFKRKEEPIEEDKKRLWLEREKIKFAELCDIAEKNGVPEEELERLRDKVQKL